MALGLGFPCAEAHKPARTLNLAANLISYISNLTVLDRKGNQNLTGTGYLGSFLGGQAGFGSAVVEDVLSAETVVSTLRSRQPAWAGSVRHVKHLIISLDDDITQVPSTLVS